MFPRAMAKAMPIMGLISGATSMPPMMTAALLTSRPRVAMVAARDIIT